MVASGCAGAGARTINGSGATFPKLFYEEAIAELEEVNDEIVVNYNAVGSGQGKKDLSAGTVDWAGSDSLVKDDEVSNFDRPFLYFPSVAAPITVSYNLPGVEGLRLSQDTLGSIFMGEIERWDDAAIATDNPDLELPSTPLTVAVRSDGSGTTSNFTKYLERAAPEVFTVTAGDTVAWPRAQAARGNAGVAHLIQDTPGAIGYVDYSDAKPSGLALASVRNRSGNYVAPSLEAASAALAGAELNDDLTYDPLDADGPEAYPITAPTYILVYETYPEDSTVENLKVWLRWVLGEGQDVAAVVDFARLPTNVLEPAQAQIDRIQVG
nr:phosphate ABC transporter substrate-binding protein PstS [Rhabdothermincola salaria]